MTNQIQLAPRVQAFAESAALSPLPCTLGPQQGRLALDEAQAGKVRKPAVDMEDLTITASPREQVAPGSTSHPTPQNTQSPLPVIVYFHGSGWVFGSPQAYDLLVGELAIGAGAAVVSRCINAVRRFATRPLLKNAIWWRSGLRDSGKNMAWMPECVQAHLWQNTQRELLVATSPDRSLSCGFSNEEYQPLSSIQTHRWPPRDKGGSGGGRP